MAKWLRQMEIGKVGKLQYDLTSTTGIVGHAEIWR